MAQSHTRAPSRRDVLCAGGAGMATLTLGGSADAREMIVREDLQAVFTDMGLVGTFVAFDVRPNRFTFVHPERAEKRYGPASTFKIPNTLIAFATRIVENPDVMFRYDGQSRGVKAWERDMTLREAMAVSNVPAYQQLARGIGLPRYMRWLDRLDYGNRMVGEPVDRFWLDGPLEISALEQVQFLAVLALGQLPASARAQAMVRDMIRIEDKGSRVLFAKTGWTGGIGWWVGWVEEGDRVTAFALNIDMATIDMAPKRIAVGKELLARLDVY